MTAGTAIVGLEAEFVGVDLGDTRLDDRLFGIVPQLALAPDDSFPDQMESDAELEGLYRFLSNSRVTVAAMLAPHVRKTHDRLRGMSVVRVLHDSSAFKFEGDRDGLGIIRRDTKGFYGHVALAVAADDTRQPFGVLGLRTHIHEDAAKNRGKTHSQRTQLAQKKPREGKETSRWENLAIEVSAQLPESIRAIHVMDREGGSYDIMAALREKQLGFVIRVNPNRLTSEEISAKDVLAKNPSTLFRTVHVTPRAARTVSTRKHPARTDREAALSIRWGSVTLRPGQYVASKLPELDVFAVHVIEENPPAGEEATEWMLFTSEQVTCLEQAAAVVDHYRARWVIEEYFKALKTGCSFEKRQLTTLDGLVRALALFVPLAWRLLLLRHLGRADGTVAAEAIFDAEQLLLLRALLAKRCPSYDFATAPTVRDAMLAVARLGGHIKNNGDPGWQVLGRGFVRLAEAEVGWRLARGSDQS